MKNLIWPVVALIITAGMILGFRYSVLVDSPVVAKIDRLTGDVWIVNSGMWRKVEIPPVEEKPVLPAAAYTTNAGEPKK